MEFLSWIPKFIAELSYKLFSNKSELDLAQKQRFADLIDKIADCVKKIGESIRVQKHAVAECAELSIYLKEMHILAREITDEKTAEKLMFWLHHVQDIRGIAVKIDPDERIKTGSLPEKLVAKRDRQSQRVLEISGMLRAIANLLKL